MSEANKRKNPSKREIVVIDDEESGGGQPIVKYVKMEEEPVLPPEVVELKQRVSIMKERLKLADRGTREAELRAEAAENLLVSNRRVKDENEEERKKNQKNLEKKLAEMTSQLGESRRGADNTHAVNSGLTRENAALKKELAETKSMLDEERRKGVEKESNYRAKSDSTGDLLDMFDDGTEKRGEISFMDLPDDIIINIFEFLDLPSRFKMRLNKRLNQLQFEVKTLKKLILCINFQHFEFELSDGPSCEYRDFNALEQRLRKLAANTYIDWVLIFVREDLNEQHVPLIDALSNIKACRLSLLNHTWSNLPQITLSTLLNFAQNVRWVELKRGSYSLSAQDMCTLRKTMLEEKCKLEYIVVAVEQGTKSSFLRECFGVTIEDVRRPFGKIYRATDDSVKLYSCDPGSNHGWNHYEAKFKTSTDERHIIFEKGEVRQPNVEDKIIMNLLY